MPKPDAGIFCLEGEWDPDLTDRTSVVPTLELLHRLEAATFIHRDVATREELSYYFGRLGLKPYERYRVIQLAMHDDTGKLWLNQKDRRAVNLFELADLMDGACARKYIYFASCATMDADDRELRKFLDITGARLICGYRKAVDWVESAAFELYVLAMLADTKAAPAVQRRLDRSPFQQVGAHLGSASYARPDR